ncbi:MAG: Rrf2 family transcriptional regulator [Phycisphaerales bacterium]|nr:Rrf2 family transcriptional regulator [Phycisphaerales bacterium]
MLCLSKKSEYALVALAHLAEQPGRTASAREIAQARLLPPALLMNILKNLQAHGLLRSTRGVKGGYRIDRELNSLSLYELIAIVECAANAAEPDCGCLEHLSDAANDMEFARFAGSQGPVQALQFKLVRFLKDVRVADLVLPGRRIDVPIERLKFKETHQPDRRMSHADHA